VRIVPPYIEAGTPTTTQVRQELRARDAWRDMNCLGIHPLLSLSQGDYPIHRVPRRTVSARDADDGPREGHCCVVDPVARAEEYPYIYASEELLEHVGAAEAEAVVRDPLYISPPWPCGSDTGIYSKGSEALSEVMRVILTSSHVREAHVRQYGGLHP
jgi:hypothetical protein